MLRGAETCNSDSGSTGASSTPQSAARSKVSTSGADVASKYKGRTARSTVSAAPTAPTTTDGRSVQSGHGKAPSPPSAQPSGSKPTTRLAGAYELHLQSDELGCAHGRRRGVRCSVCAQERSTWRPELLVKLAMEERRGLPVRR